MSPDTASAATSVNHTLRWRWVTVEGSAPICFRYLYRHGANTHLAAVVVIAGLRHKLAIEVRAVLAAQILDRGRTARHDDSRVAAGDAGGIDADGTVAIAAHVDSDLQRGATPGASR